MLSRIRIALALTSIGVAVALPTVALGSVGGTKAPPDWIERFAAAQQARLAAMPAPPDWIERFAAAHRHALTGILDGRSPDTLDAASAARQFLQQTADGRSPDTLDAAAAAQQVDQQVIDGRSPDTIDAAHAVQPVEIVSPSAFDWSDAGIGAGVATGLLGILGGLGLSFSTYRRRMHTA